ncbi:MAG: GPW/gp25 family protein [Bacteroidota bacterium]
MMKKDRSFLGRGWSFPPKFALEKTAVVMVEAEEDIAQSILIILSTRKGERLINPEFGCGIHDLVFEEIDTSIKYQIKDLIGTALLFFEPRIKVLDIEVKLDQQVEGRINIIINYVIKTVNKRSNMVYPFYFLEGTDLRY